MERTKKIIAEFKKNRPQATGQEVFNTLREYIQILVLKLVFQSKFGGALSFLGGTALRICYQLKRYSEDLDFALDDKKVPYNFSALMREITREFTLRGFDVESSCHEDKIVQKGFLRFAGLGPVFGLKGFQQSQKLHIKLEVDVRPPRLKKGERESFFVNRFQEIFPILKHTLPTLFAGKLLAILYRPYARGRDYYDLVWYLSQKTEPNIDYFNRASEGKKFKGRRDVFEAVKKQVKKITPTAILKDVGQFLEDPSERKWILEYEKIFRMLAKSG